MSFKPSSELEHARLALEINAKALESKKNVGAPLKGKEPRIPLRMRMEPGEIIELHELTGRNCSELLSEMLVLLREAKQSFRDKLSSEGITLSAAMQHLLIPQHKAEAS
jgi:hypothetical protein